MTDKKSSIELKLIGYCGPAQKWQKIGWDAIMECGKKRGFQFKAVDLTKSIEEQGEFSLIIHKISNLIVNGNHEAIQQLKLFSNRHPEVPIIDNLDAVAITLNRSETTKLCQSIQFPTNLNFQIAIPKTILINDSSEISVIVPKLHFPILVKPCLSDVVESAHVFSLYGSPGLFVDIQTPSIVQEYINHGGIVYKCYALGDHLEADCRQSTRNIQPNESIKLDFKSQFSPQNNNDLWNNVEDETLSKIPIPYDNFKIISSILRQKFNIQLLGFDIIIDQNNTYWIIDINYFPGYKKIENLPEKFIDFLQSSINTL